MTELERVFGALGRAITPPEATPTAEVPYSLDENGRFWGPVAISVLLSPFSAIAGMVSVGFVHASGLLVISKIFFPYLVLILRAANDDAAAMWVPLLLPPMQTIAYGLWIGRAWQKHYLPVALRWIIGSHVVATVISCIAMPTRQF